MSAETEAPKIPMNYGRHAMFGLIVALSVFGGLGTWAATARIDSAVIASGVVSVETNSKKIQHLEGGIVAELMVREHQKVSAGDVLLKLNPLQANATYETHRTGLIAALALEARLVAERNGAKKITFPPELSNQKSTFRTEMLMGDQRNIFAKRRTLLQRQINILESRVKQQQSQLNGIKVQRGSLKIQGESLTREFSKVESLAKRGLYPSNKLEGLRRSVLDNEARYNQTEAEIARLSDTISETRLQILQTEQKFLEEVAQKIREARLQIAEYREKISVSRDLRKRLSILAPQNGIVQNIKVHTIGGVVRAGDTLMEIVPNHEVFRVHARVSPLDINYIKVGLSAEVRFPGIKSRTTPLILGKVHSISADTLVQEQNREPYFLAIVEVAENDLPAELKSARLTAGMPTEVIISTGARTVADYLIAPLTDAARKTMRQN